MENLAFQSASASLLEAFALSDVGCVRTNNEDNFLCQSLWTDNYLLLAAIDGVGGQEGGEVASAIAAGSIPQYLQTYTNGDALQLLKQAVRQANDDIFEQRLQRPEVSRMSCVLTSAIVDSRHRLVHMAHVGDTRLYLFANGVLKKLSHDHSLVGYREEIGDLTEEQAMHHPQRNLISRDVGSERYEDDSFVEGESFPLPADAMLLLCSDGLTDLITSAQIVSILQRKGTVEEKCRQLVDAAKAAGGKDNVTVVLARYTGEAHPDAKKHPSTAPASPAPQPTSVPAPQAIKQSSGQTIRQSRNQAIKESSKLRPWVLSLLMLVVGLAAGFVLSRYAMPLAAPLPPIHDTIYLDSLPADSLHVDSLSVDSLSLDEKNGQPKTSDKTSN